MLYLIGCGFLSENLKTWIFLNKKTFSALSVDPGLSVMKQMEHIATKEGVSLPQGFGLSKVALIKYAPVVPVDTLSPHSRRF